MRWLINNEMNPRNESMVEAEVALYDPKIRPFAATLLAFQGPVSGSRPIQKRRGSSAR